MKRVDLLRKEDKKNFKIKLEVKEEEIAEFRKEIERKQDIIERLYTDKSLFLQASQNLSLMLIQLHEFFVEIIKAAGTKDFDFFFNCQQKLLDFDDSIDSNKFLQYQNFEAKMRKFLKKIEKGSSFLRWADNYSNEDDSVFINNDDFINISEKEKKDWKSKFRNLDDKTLAYMQRLIQNQNDVKDELDIIKKSEEKTKSRLKSKETEFDMMKEKYEKSLAEMKERFSNLDLKYKKKLRELAKVEAEKEDLKDQLYKGIVDENRASNKEANSRVSSLISKLANGFFFLDSEYHAKVDGVDKMFKDQMVDLKMVRNKLMEYDEFKKNFDIGQKVKINHEIALRAKSIHSKLDVLKLMKEVLDTRKPSKFHRFLLLMESDLEKKITEARGEISVARRVSYLKLKIET